jgi:DnaK suppressor protein
MLALMARKDQLERLGGQLKEMQKELFGSSGTVSFADIGEREAGDVVDDAQYEVSAEMVGRNQESRDALLLEINQAINRFRNGVYGICEDCNAEKRGKAHIPITRLKALPFANFCAEHQKKREEKGGVSPSAGSNMHLMQQLEPNQYGLSLDDVRNLGVNTMS